MKGFKSFICGHKTESWNRELYPSTINGTIEGIKFMSLTLFYQGKLGSVTCLL